MTDCIFCKIAKGEIPCEKIWEDKNFIAFADVHPVAEGHTLIIPKKHFENIFELPSLFGNEPLDTAKEQGLRLVKEKKAEGIKLVQNNGKAAGQEVMHFHLHIIPEKSDVKREKFV